MHVFVSACMFYYDMNLSSCVFVHWRAAKQRRRTAKKKENIIESVNKTEDVLESVLFANLYSRRRKPSMLHVLDSVFISILSIVIILYITIHIYNINWVMLHNNSTPNVSYFFLLFKAPIHCSLHHFNRIRNEQIDTRIQLVCVEYREQKNYIHCNKIKIKWIFNLIWYLWIIDDLH